MLFFTVAQPAVNSGLHELDKAIRGVCTHFRLSVLGSSVLGEIQKKHNVTIKKPPSKATTRWTGRAEQVSV